MPADLCRNTPEDYGIRSASGKRPGMKIVRAACLAYLGIVLFAGLWPFHVQENNVQWLAGRDGLEFGRHGIVLTAGSIDSPASQNAAETLEIWLEPAQGAGNATILSFDRSTHPGEPLSLHQVGESLYIRRNNVDPQGISRTALVIVDQLLKPNVPIFLTVTLDGEGSRVYANGVEAKVSSLHGARNDLTGRILLANSLRVSDSWSGKIYGLAAYRRELTVARDCGGLFELGKREAERRPASIGDTGPVALYLFDERSGQVVHNKVGAGPDFTISERFFVPHPYVLRSPWSEYHATWGYWQDVLTNIAGFVPLGGLIYLCLTSIPSIRHPASLTIVLGFAISVAIELVQIFLPTRLSDLTDVITNVAGTSIGALMCRTSMVQTLLRMIRVNN